MLVDNSIHNHGCNKPKFKKPVIECLEPRFIVNRNLPELVSKFGHYYFHGQWFHEPRKWHSFFHFDLRPFNRFLDKVTFDNFQENFVVDTITGEFYPIYICVPCGHCDLCLHKKQISFVNRIKYESFMFPYQPIFVTLTYKDECLPDFGVSIRDCQLFLKRFRQNLIRSGFNERIRYALVSEYGSPEKTFRPHYHAIFFGLPVYSPQDLFRVQSIVEKSWSNGFVLARQIDMRDSNTAFYTSKYMRKKCRIPKGSHDVFCLSSRGHGGLGSAFFAKQAKMLRKRVQREFDVLNPWTQKTEKFMWSGYALDKIYPSEKKYIPYKLRVALKNYLRSVAAWKATMPELFWLFEKNFEAIKKKFGGYIYMPWNFTERSIHVTDYDCAGDIYESEREVMKYMEHDFSDVKKIARCREFLLSNISLDRSEIDIVQKTARIRRDIKRLEKLEVL